VSFSRIKPRFRSKQKLGDTMQLKKFESPEIQVELNKITNGKGINFSVDFYQILENGFSYSPLFFSEREEAEEVFEHLITLSPHGSAVTNIKEA
jgi:hypothetical protein